MSAPGFLVVGAQKCGTTTLFEDLRSHPDIYVPDKESSGLLDPRLPEPAAVEGYRALFSAARGPSERPSGGGRCWCCSSSRC